MPRSRRLSRPHAEDWAKPLDFKGAEVEQHNVSLEQHSGPCRAGGSNGDGNESRCTVGAAISVIALITSAIDHAICAYESSSIAVLIDD